MSKLTGNTRFRTTWRGKMILQVQVQGDYYYEDGGAAITPKWWRDASVTDIRCFVIEGTEFTPKIGEPLEEAA